MYKKLPEMTVEKRVSETAHGLKTFPYEQRAEQLKEAIVLNHDGAGRYWKDTTINILKKYIPLKRVTESEIIGSVADVLGMLSWSEVSKFVVDDMCSEFFNYALKYCLKTKQKHRKDEGFIDGAGIGYLDVYLDDLKVTLEKAFDAKYYFQVRRPLEWAQEELELDLSGVANAIHPGHWSYPAGHGTKFLTAVATLNKVFKLDKKTYRKLLIVACVASMGRSGSLIHYPIDNLAAGVYTGLKEFKK